MGETYWKRCFRFAVLLLPLLLLASVGAEAQSGAGRSEGTIPAPDGLSLGAVYSDAQLISPWAYEHIERATERKLVEGSGGRLHPKGYITRAEFTKLIVVMLRLDAEEGRSLPFHDVSEEDWHYRYVSAAYGSGLVSGYTDKLFLPDGRITRQEMAVIMARALAIPSGGADDAGLKDLTAADWWARAAINDVASLSIMGGDADYFRPLDWATREMAFVVAVRGYDYINAPAGEDESALRERRLKQLRQLIRQNAAYMQQMVPSPAFGSLAGEWTIIGLARSGEPVPAAYYASYYRSVSEAAARLMPATAGKPEGRLDRSKGTEHSRLILALASIGNDIENVGGYDLRQALADFDYVQRQGINGPIFALIAFDSYHYDIPIDEGVKTQTTREGLIAYLLEREIEGGGWALGVNPVRPDPDITAMALQALTPYYDSRRDAREAIARGVDWLSNAQDISGGYRSWGALNAESVAQVVVALSGLGIDADADPRFVKKNGSALEALLLFAAAEGGFYHILDGEAGNGGADPGAVDAMATDQGMYALVAYYRYLRGSNALYHMTDRANGGDSPVFSNKEAVE